MDKFFSEQTKKENRAPHPTAEQPKTGEGDTTPQQPKRLPKGVVLGKDGKPCRSCSPFASWVAMTKSQNPASSPLAANVPATSSTGGPPADCPPDVDTLGNHTWTLLHAISASYPPSASPTEQREMRQFLHLFSKLYPCWSCAEDFREWMGKEGNGPMVEGREGLGRWMCEAHNEVNVKLGKERFDCGKWEERWRTGWRDGRCG